MHHFRKTKNTYVLRNSTDRERDACTLCHNIAESNIRMSTETMNVIPNRVHYDMFEGRRVIDHLMIVPKRHVESIGEFNDSEHGELMKIIAEYEKREYGFYGRGVGGSTRSVAHQHTHLIKLAHKAPHLIVHTTKPYWLFSK
jgi:diadenosine tetraphosphate (Ap4A) HIT family hydrolase